MPLRSLLPALVDLVLPRACAGCSRPGTGLCAACASLVLAGAARVPASWVGPAVPPTASAGGYRGTLRRVVLAWKGGRHDLTPVLGAALAGAVVLALDAPPDVAHPVGRAAAAARPAARARGLLLLPVPSAPSSVRERGAALTRDLARACAAVLVRTGTEGVVVAPPGALSLARAPDDQVGLGAAARSANLHRAHRASPRLRGACCLLVDDVVTTGATLAEAARAVAGCGGRVVGAVTVAATPPPGR